MGFITHTSNDLIADIKRRISLPSNDTLFSDADLLDFLNEELETYNAEARELEARIRENVTRILAESI